MLSSSLYQILIFTGIIFAAFIIIGVIIARLYTRSIHGGDINGLTQSLKPKSESSRVR
ncbi:hypothetical protein [Acinetobacter silvestris]|uniref:hypothetical protein n=1 Tax=Acinetobacter silvestris TaxID=1977882 RepID=UPI00148A8BFF|nr:hypothetical protein [Acinetobacter silvestris]